MFSSSICLPPLLFFAANVLYVFVLKKVSLWSTALKMSKCKPCVFDSLDLQLSLKNDFLTFFLYSSSLCRTHLFAFLLVL
jgi:hypothetical protein